MNALEIYQRLDVLVPPYMAMHDGLREHELRNFVRRFISSEAAGHIMGWIYTQIGDGAVWRDPRTHKFYLTDQIVKSDLLC